MSNAPVPFSRMLTAVAYVHYPERPSYWDDWLDAFRQARELEVVSVNLATPFGRRRFHKVVRDADLVVLLHSVIGDSLGEIRRCRAALHERRGTLLAFVGNELSVPTVPIRDKLALLRELSPELIGTQLLPEAGEHLYAEVGDATVVALPHALNPDVYRPRVRDDRRPVDVGFRGARYLAHVGDDDRDRIIDYFTSRSFDPPLATDVKTGSLLGRRAWSRFLNRCRGSIGTESGSWYLERDDLVLTGIGGDAAPRREGRLRSGSRLVTRYLPRSAKAPLRRGIRSVRPKGTADEAAPLGPLPDPVVYGKCVSSRHFDAIGTETCQILFPGRYNDVLEADRHYLKLERDFSNIDDVLARFRDRSERRRLVTDTRNYVLDSHTYRHRVDAAIAAVRAS